MMTSKDLVRPNGIPMAVQEHDPARRPRKITFNKWLVAGQNVEFNEQEEKLYLGGDPLDAKSWVEFRGRIDQIFLRAQAIKKAPEPSRGKPASDFLNANLHLINSIKRGKIKKNWLTRLFGWMGVDWVITNEELTGEDPW
jgi:hypothetical protein